MATVVFSTVGQAVGGPLGAGIGAAVGSSLDNSLFRRGRGGAEDGYAGRSAYGEVIPMVFGRTRVAGHLIWATAPSAGGSKGEGRQARSTSFAMAVSRGAIRDVGRIWADGGLLRNASGELLTPTEMRVHSAGDSVPDPLIVAAEGANATPAYVRLSYILFENFDLGPYGNRIPSLSFEVVGATNSAVAWLEELTTPIGAELEISPNMGLLEGYTARLDPFSDDLAVLLGATGCRLGIRRGRLAILDQPRVSQLTPSDLICGEDDAEGEGLVRHDVRPSGLGLAFQDRDRDYQLGWQQEVRHGRGQSISLSWSAAAAAPGARAIALRLLREAEAGADTISFAVPHRFIDISVGDVVSFADGVSWLIVGRELRGLSVRLDGQRLPYATAQMPVPTDPGRIVAPASAPVPPSIAKVIEPVVPIGTRTGAAILIAASGGAGWRGADVRLLQGADDVPIGFAGESLPYGILAADLGNGPSTIWDERNNLVLEVPPQDAVFLSRGHGDVLDRGGLVSVGEELLQYRRCDALAPGVVRLSGLLRGRFGTMAVGASAGVLVMALPRFGGAWLDIEADQAGRDLSFLIGGAGDPPGGQAVPYRVRGAGRAPFAPVHLAGTRLADGTLFCSWIGRDRGSWRWEQEDVRTDRRYAWHFRAGAATAWTLPASGDGIQVSPAAQLAAFGDLLTAGEFRVEALGDGPDELRFSQWLAI